MEEKRNLVETILKRHGFMERHGFTRVERVDIEPAVGVNENFGSLMERLKVTLKKDQEEGDNIFSFILKIKTSSNGDFDLFKAFPVEHKIYQNTLQSMNEILKKEEDDDIPWPKYFGCECNSLLLEDLHPKGYKMARKHGLMNIDHVKMSVEGLAKFHALSMILIEKGDFNKESLGPSIYAQNLPFMIDMHNSAFNGLILSMERSWGEEWQNAAGKIKEASRHVSDKLTKLWKDSRSKYDVLNHGDCWTNNMLYKYSEVTGKPQHVKLVDFQLCHCNSPCWDLIHFLYTALLPEVRERHMSSLLKTYADALDETCRKYGFTGSIPRITYLQETISKLSYYAFVLCCSSLPILVASSQELNPSNQTLEHEANTGIHYPLYRFDVVKETMKKELKWFLETCK